MIMKSKIQVIIFLISVLFYLACGRPETTIEFKTPDENHQTDISEISQSGINGRRISRNHQWNEIDFQLMQELRDNNIATSKVNTDDINFGDVPWKDPTLLSAGYKNLMEYLSKGLSAKLGAERNIYLNITKDYNTLLEDLKGHYISFASLNPATYAQVLMDQEFKQDIEYLATTTANTDQGAGTFYTSYIVALKSSGITSIQQLKEKVFGFVSERSTSGFKYPLKTLRDEIDPINDLSKCFFLGGHEKVIQALVDGTIDAGAIGEHALTAARTTHGEIFHIVKTTGRIPLNAYVAHKSLGTQVISALRELLLKLDRNSTNPEIKKVFESEYFLASSFKHESEELYSDVVSVQKAIKDYHLQCG